MNAIQSKVENLNYESAFSYVNDFSYL